VPTTRRLLLGAGLVSLAGPRHASAAAAPVPRAKPLPLGAIFPLSGPLSALGDESLRGATLAIEARNAAGGLFGRSLTLVTGDASDEAKATAEAHRLIEREGAALLLGSYASTVSLAASAVAELAGRPYVELDATADAITARGLKLLARLGYTAGQAGALAIDAVTDMLAPHWGAPAGALRIALVFEDGPAGASVAAGAQARAASRSLPPLESIAYGAATIDFTQIVMRLRAVQADVVIHAALAEDVVAFHAAMQQAHWLPRMVIGTGGGYALRDAAQAVGPAFAGVLVVGVTPYRIAPAVAPGAAAVASAYQQRYGAPPRSGHSLVCFAGVQAVLNAAVRAGDLDPTHFGPALHALDIPDHATPAGWGIRLNAAGQNTRAYPLLAQWQDGTLATLAPQSAAAATLIPRLGP
jgi:branched-chain amino acid transport system substrate-binding protein